MSIKSKEKVPGLNEAKAVLDTIHRAGIEDVKLFYDNTILPFGMWCVVQVKRDTSRILMPDSYKQENLQPLIMWWCKDEHGRFRVPNQQDASDIIISVKRAQVAWKKGGDKLDDEFIKQDQAKEAAHRAKQRERIHAVAPDLQKAIQRELK